MQGSQAHFGDFGDFQTAAPVEVGDQEMCGFVARVADDGGLVAEHDKSETLAALEKGLAGWFNEQGTNLE